MENHMKIHYVILLVSYFFVCFCKIFPQQQYQIQDTTLAAKYFAVGDSLSKAARYDSSNVYFEKAGKIYKYLYSQTKNFDICKRLVSGENRTGWNLIMQGKYDDANELLNKNLSLVLKVFGENNLEAAQCYHVLGVVYWAKEDYPNSITFHKKALDIRLHLLGEENSQVASSYNNLGIDFNEMGDRDKALEYYGKSLAIDLKVNTDEPSLAKAYNNVGNVYLDKDDYDKALEYHQKALSIRLRVHGEINPYTADSYENIGIIYGQKAEYHKALEYFNKSLSIRIQVFGASHPWVAESYNELANCYYYMGILDTALQDSRKSLDLLKNFSGERKREILNIYTVIGKIYEEMGDYHSASENLNRVISLANQDYGEKNLYSGVAYKRLAEVNELGHNYDDALFYCQKALISLVKSFKDKSIYNNPPLTGIISEIELLNTLSLKAVVFDKLSNHTGTEDLATAFSTYKLASDLIDQIRTGYKAEGSKLFLGEKTNEIYNNAIRVSLKLFDITKDDHFKKESFYFAEKSKAAVLEQSLAEVKAAKFAGIPDSLLEHEKQLNIDLTYYETALQNEYQKNDKRDENKISDYENQLFGLKALYDELISDFEKRFPDYYNLKYQKQEISVDEIQSSLKENTALLDYSMDDSVLYVFLITKNDFSVYTVNLPNDFSELVRNFYSSIVKAAKSEYINAANKLSKFLIDPLLPELTSIEKLVIIPSGELYKIPFEALFIKKMNPEEADFSRLTYLIKKYDVSYHYSAFLYISSLKKELSASNKNIADNFIGYAPVFSDGGNARENVNLQYLAVPAADTSEAFRSISPDGKKFNELKYSEWEVKSILNLYPLTSDKLSDIAYFHSDATEESFKNNAKNYKIIHIASHSFINETHPDLSAIVFAQPRDSASSEDGILYAAETYNLDLKADLVVLSSCESGLGKLIKGEGMMALTRGFLYAGASNIIFSLWKIPDKQTSELMIDFYKNMLSGEDYSRALREAKLKLIANYSAARPRSWASFVLVGAE